MGRSLPGLLKVVSDVLVVVQKNIVITILEGSISLGGSNN
jgi:hypothetical protein